MLERLRQFKFPKATRKIVLILLALLTIDALLSLGIRNQSVNLETFLGNPEKIFSDLLFLEGATIFCIGAFLTLRITEFHSKRMAFAVFLMIVGSGFMGFAMVIDVLFAKIL